MRSHTFQPTEHQDPKCPDQMLPSLFDQQSDLQHDLLPSIFTPISLNCHRPIAKGGSICAIEPPLEPVPGNTRSNQKTLPPGEIFELKVHKNVFVAVLCPGPTWGAYSTPQASSSINVGPLHGMGMESKALLEISTYRPVSSAKTILSMLMLHNMHSDNDIITHAPDIICTFNSSVYNCHRSTCSLAPKLT